MTPYQYKNEHNNTVDCLSKFTYEIVNGKGIDREPTDDNKHEAAREARQGSRLSALKIALMAIKGASHEEELKAERIIKTYLF